MVNIFTIGRSFVLFFDIFYSIKNLKINNKKNKNKNKHIKSKSKLHSVLS